ncbi:hypothetical protein [Yersinia intermedia]|uniref:hypothetical protein n=1 Tax=Yersinia intermedia TaxID=631 RepID=UPI00119CD117|nr:hypothetical protein [Yersinia intermedia]
MKLRVLNSNEIALEVKKGVVVGSISEISRILGLDRATIAKSIRNHGVTPAGMRRGNPIYPLPAVARRVINGKFW